MDIKKRVLIVILACVTISGFLSAAASARVWTREALYAPKYFSFNKRGIALDSSGRSHMVYGGDHLWHAYYDGTAWQYETVDASDGVGRGAMIAIDAFDHIHIIYYDDRSGGLKYTTNRSGSWVADTLPVGGGGAHIAVDSQGYAHISYLETFGRTYNVRYATNASGSWQSETVGGFHWHHHYTSLAIDSSDQVYICFTNSVGRLTLATNVSGSWVFQEIDSGVEPSIAVDTSDHLHIAYRFSNQLRYATNDSGGWETSSHVLPDAPESLSLAFGSGVVHIAYYDWTDKTIKYVTKDGESWGGPFPIVEGHLPSIVLDASGTVLLGYITDEGLHYATNGSGSWVPELIDVIGYAGHSSLAVDPSDHIHISFATNQGLKYATNISGEWATELIDPDGEYSSISADFSGRAHMIYYDQRLHDLKYATNSSGDWATETIDPSWQAGKPSYMGVDASGYAHVYYFAGSAGEGTYLRHATNASGSWEWNIVGDLDYEREPPTVAVDSSGHAHICYFDASGALKYANNTGGSLAVETLPFGADRLGDICVDQLVYVHLAFKGGSDIMHATNRGDSWITETVGTGGGNINVAADSFGRVHMTFLTDVPGEPHLKYAVKVLDDWETEVVDTHLGAIMHGYSIGFELDSLGRAHISYPDLLMRDLKYASSDVWITHTVETGEIVTPSNTSIAVDSSDGLHMSYQIWSSNRGYTLGYATTAGGSWATEVVDHFMEPGQFNDLAVDSNDNVHICYYEEIYYQLKYASNAAGGWASEGVENRHSFTGTFCSIAVDRFDKLHIIYLHARDQAVKYATNASGDWVTEVVAENVGPNGGHTAIAVDLLGHAHISYNDNGDLKYATNRSGLWLSYEIDTESLVRGQISIAVGPSGHIHITYMDGTWENQAIKYASNLSGDWIVETLDSSHCSIGSTNSIAVDRLGHVHISYNLYDGAENDLRYVSNVTGSWEIETVDNQGDVGMYSSIAVDSRSTVHVSYHDRTNGSLKYAFKALVGSQPEYQVDQINDASPNSSRGCGLPPCGLGGMFQSFTPSASSLGAVELTLRAGGGFPEIGYFTGINIRFGTPYGAVLGVARSFVPGPLGIGEKITARFQFLPSVILTPGDTYVMEWICPEQGDSILTWMVVANENPYAGGTAFGCIGVPIETNDFVFTTYNVINTIEGENIMIQPVDPTTGMTPVVLVCQSVGQAGTTSLVITSSGPPEPTGYQHGNPTTYYELTTTAVIYGPTQVCINYSGISYFNETRLALFHCDSGICEDITTLVDTGNDMICGMTDSLSDFAILEPKGLTIEIDIKPGSYTNGINLNSKGKVPVAILTTAEFDAACVDAATVIFAGAEPVRWRLKDVDKDGDRDMLFHFKTEELDLGPESTEAALTGDTSSEGIYFMGVDTVKIVPKGKAK